MHTLLEAIKNQRQIWAWAIIIGLFLVLMGKAPVGPVCVGAFLAASIATLRSWRRSMLRPIPLPDNH